MTTSNEHNNAPAVPQGEPVAWMVYGNYTRQPFGMLCSAEAYMRGLLKSDPDGGYHIRPLRYTTPAPAPAQEVGLTDEEIEAIAKKHMSTVGDHWCNEDAIRERHAEDFARAIISALRAKGGKHV